MNKLITTLLLISFAALTARAAKDPFVDDSEPGKPVVSVPGCVFFGGKVSSKLHKTYRICDGGKYDWYIVGGNHGATPALACEGQILAAQLQINEDKFVDDEGLFLDTALDALEACKISAGKNKKVLAVVEAARAACLQAADQSSRLYHGMCLLKSAELVKHLTH